MRFLLDANMPRCAARTLHGLGHACEDVRDLGMGNAADAQVAAYAREHTLILVTRDGDFANIRNYPPESYPGIVVLQLPDYATADSIAALLGSFASNESLVGTRTWPPGNCGGGKISPPAGVTGETWGRWGRFSRNRSRAVLGPRAYPGAPGGLRGSRGLCPIALKRKRRVTPGELP